MGVSISEHYTTRTYHWSAWKNVQSSAKSGSFQYDDDGTVYTIWLYDGPEVHLCTIWKDVVPNHILSGGYTQDQNDTDKTDFETNYKAAGNQPVEKREPDGRAIIRISTALPGRRFRLRTIYFETSAPSALHNKEAGGGGTDLGDAVVKCYSGDGTDVTAGDLTTAVKTTLAFEAQEDIEMIGGWLVVDSSLIGGVSNNWWMSVLAAPDIPRQYGGSIDYVNEVNLEMLSDSKVSMDGRASAPVPYDPTYHSGKLLFVVRHPAGSSKRFQVFLECFK